jgi:hypothetical protein
VDDDPGESPRFAASGPRRREEMRDPLTYTSVSEWFRDYQGRVPIQMAHGLDRYMQRTGATFAEAYAALRGAGAIIELEYPEDPPATA